MIKTTTEYFCDCCGKNMTSERYRWRTSFEEACEVSSEVECAEHIFCKDCTISFTFWRKERRIKVGGYPNIISVGNGEYALGKGSHYSDLTKEEREIMKDHAYRD